MADRKAAASKDSLDKLKAAIVKEFKEKIDFSETKSGDLLAIADSKKIISLAEVLKGARSLKFDYLKCLFGVDKEKHFEVVYHFYSTANNVGLLVKAILNRNNPKVATLTTVYLAADWYERETAEMFGITFEGHPNPKNILLADDFEGHPLRKDFLLPDERGKFVKKVAW